MYLLGYIHLFHKKHSLCSIPCGMFCRTDVHETCKALNRWPIVELKSGGEDNFVMRKQCRKVSCQRKTTQSKREIYRQSAAEPCGYTLATMMNRPRPTVGPDAHSIPVALTCHSAVFSVKAAHGGSKCPLTPLLVWGRQVHQYFWIRISPSGPLN